MARADRLKDEISPEDAYYWHQSDYKVWKGIKLLDSQDNEGMNHVYWDNPTGKTVVVEFEGQAFKSHESSRSYDANYWNDWELAKQVTKYEYDTTN